MPSLRGTGAVLAAAVLCLTSAAVAVAEPADPAGEPTTTATTAPPETPPETQPEIPAEPQPETEPGTQPETRSVHDFDVVVTFDKASYATGEDMRITVAVTNNGVADTVSAFASTLDPDSIRVRDWGDLNGRVPVAAGGTLTRTVTGSVANPEITTARLDLVVTDSTGAGRLFEPTVPVTPRFAQAAGVAFDDRDGDNRLDAGEGLAGVDLTWRNEIDDTVSQTVTSAADGTYALRVATGTYFVTGTAPGGLLVGWRRVTVGPSGVDDVLFRAVRPLTDLAAGLEFTKDVYGKDEAPVVRVTLTNKGDLPLTGVMAYCNRAGSGAGMDGVGAGWGDLAFGKGVAIAPHSTLHLDVTEPMPSGAYDRGRVFVDCDFGYLGVEDDSNPVASDQAAVPGMRGVIEGTIADEGTGIAGARVVLVTTEEKCRILAEGATDAEGRFRFADMPVGVHDVYLFPPAGWQAEHDNPTSVQLYGAGPAGLLIELAPGDAPHPALPEGCAPATAPTTTSPAAPAPQGSAAPGLASTGASIAGPGVAGVLALLAGVGAVLVARRKTA